MQTDSKGAIAAIGTTLEIKSHVMLEDGRMGIESIGAILQPSLCSVHNIVLQERLLFCLPLAGRVLLLSEHVRLTLGINGNCRQGALQDCECEAGEACAGLCSGIARGGRRLDTRGMPPFQNVAMQRSFTVLLEPSD